MAHEFIEITNAFENNLKNISVKIPKKVVTGVSGSGKSSLCLDTIAAESRRELNETFPSFVQQYLPKYGRPEVERIANLPVTIFKFAMSPFAEWQQLAWAGVLIITLCVLLLNILARVVFAKNKHG